MISPCAPTLPFGGTAVEVRRSARRRRTVTAYQDAGTVVVLIPARFTKAEEREWVDKMVARVTAPSSRRRGDTDLARRAGELSRRYLDGLARPSSVRWVAPMRTRWASCTPADRTIRLSRRLQDTPTWVQDYVLVHELAHLLHAGHDDAFWRLVARYPRAERARGFLEGVSAAAQLGIGEDDLVDGADSTDSTDGTDHAGAVVRDAES